MALTDVIVEEWILKRMDDKGSKKTQKLRFEDTDAGDGKEDSVNLPKNINNAQTDIDSTRCDAFQYSTIS